MVPCQRPCDIIIGMRPRRTPERYGCWIFSWSYEQYSYASRSWERNGYNKLEATYNLFMSFYFRGQDENINQLRYVSEVKQVSLKLDFQVERTSTGMGYS